MKPIEKWMIDALEKYGNTVLNGKRVKLFGEQAIVEAFEKEGFQINLIEEDDDAGYANYISYRKPRSKKYKDYIVEVNRGKNICNG